jgi:hypothetical protein
VYRPASLILLLLLGSAGCSIVLKPGEAQCDTDADCSSRGFTSASCVEQVCVQQAAPPADPIWGCLGNVVEPTPDETKKVEFSIQLVFATDHSAVTTGTIDVCSKIDPTCMVMDPKYPKGLSPDGNGFVQVSVFQGFDGFVRIANPEIVDTRVYVGRPLTAPPIQKSVLLLRPGEYSALASLAGGAIDPARGTAILFAADCQKHPASKVSFQSPNADKSSLPFYLINQAPVTPPSGTATDADGYGGFFNLPAGPAVASAYRAQGNVYIGESSFQVLGNTISFVQISPTPK